MANPIRLAGLSEIEIAGVALGLQGSSTDLSARYNTTSGTDVELGKTDSVTIPIEPVLAFQATQPFGADAGINMPTTTATSTSATLTLTDDAYAKLPVDRLDFLKAETVQALGNSVGRGLITVGNTIALATGVAQSGRQTYLGTTLASATAAQLWSAINKAPIPYQDGFFDMSEFDLVIPAAMWAKLTDDIAVLRTTADARATAASILGVGQVTVAPLPQFTDAALTPVAHDTAAMLVHRRTLAVAKRIDDLRLREGDVSDYLFARVRSGAKVIVPNLITVIAAGSAPA